MDRLKIIKEERGAVSLNPAALKPWKEAEKEWDLKALAASEQHPIKMLNHFPKMPGITKETAQGLKWKSFKWMIKKDKTRKILLGFLKHPFKYGFGYLRSIFSKKSIQREKDFFLYGIDSLIEFESLLKNQENLFVLGFSYCHKPFECPSGRFTDLCLHDLKNPICQQCFIGKAFYAAPKGAVIPLLIPTVHYIGEKIFEIIHANPSKQVIFMITACEMTLTMFADFGNMVGIKGVGVRLDGRICNTMRAFALSEEGIKPGLTIVLEETKKKMLDLICLRRGDQESGKI